MVKKILWDTHTHRSFYFYISNDKNKNIKLTNTYPLYQALKHKALPKTAGDLKRFLLLMDFIKEVGEKVFPVWLRNRLSSAGLEPVLIDTEKSCIVSYYNQFSKNKKCSIMILKPVLLARAFGIL